ncbi:MAG: Zn-dependent hydrolase [Ignavibacteria bacterium]|jgi:hypothetical protein|nr:Zn-dependent hydrolase [Ignavibacteria bacterium]
MKLQIIITLCSIFLLIGCGNNNKGDEMNANTALNSLNDKLNAYSAVKIDCNLEHLTAREVALVSKLAEAGVIADEIYWEQANNDGIMVRDSLLGVKTDAGRAYLKYVLINYGPYDVLDDNKRFVGNGSAQRFAGGGFYPIDITKEEFAKHIADNPSDKGAFESGYTVIVRDENKRLTAVPYSNYYTKTERYAELLEEAAELCDEITLKNYLILRAKAARTNEYYESDVAWMDVKGKIDVIIGPIESYADGLYNYRTAYEAVVMVKDEKGSAELDMFKENINNFQHNLPWAEKYYVDAKESGTILQMVNVAYFGGNCNQGVKTIAAALPNDPAVTESKGSKKSMFKNMMEAKFDKILAPIADILLSKDVQNYVRKENMVSFVTLHEVSHNLGRGFVYNNAKLTVRGALKEKYSSLEELKADICAMYNLKYLHDIGKSSDENLKADVITYIAGLFRSMRFGAEEAHGIANYIQFRYLMAKGGIIRTKEGYYTYNSDKFFAAVSDLTKYVLELQAIGDYKAAEDLIKKYGVGTSEIKADIERIKGVPSDLNCTYTY